MTSNFTQSNVLMYYKLDKVSEQNFEENCQNSSYGSDSGFVSVRMFCWLRWSLHSIITLWACSSLQYVGSFLMFQWCMAKGSHEGVDIWCNVFTMDYSPCIDYFSRRCKVCLFCFYKYTVSQLPGALGLFPWRFLGLNRSMNVSLWLELTLR